MNVVIVNLTSGGMSGGYVKYLRRIVPPLAAYADIRALSVFMPPGQERTLDMPTLTWPANDGKHGFAELRSRVRALEPDVVFIPTARWVDTGIPTVVMVRNMEPLTYPFGGNTVSEAARNLARRWGARRACERATRVIAVSEHVREWICSHWHVPPARVGRVYHGIDPVDPSLAIQPPALRGVDTPWIFTAGSIRPARGLVDAIGAIARLDAAVRLVVAGAPDPSTVSHHRTLRQLADRLGAADRIVWPGRLSPDEMAWCYAHCTVFLATTRAEACPNTALEAMVHGCSVVSTSAEPMPEFLGDTARYYPRGQAEALAGVLRDALHEPSAGRAGRGAQARQRASRFTWDNTVRATVRELASAADSTAGAREVTCAS